MKVDFTGDYNGIGRLVNLKALTVKELITTADKHLYKTGARKRVPK